MISVPWKPEPPLAQCPRCGHFPMTYASLDEDYSSSEGLRRIEGHYHARCHCYHSRTRSDVETAVQWNDWTKAAVQDPDDKGAA